MSKIYLPICKNTPNVQLQSSERSEVEQTLETIMTHHDSFLEGLMLQMESIHVLAVMRHGYEEMAKQTDCKARQLVMKYLAKVASARINELYEGAAV